MLDQVLRKETDKGLAHKFKVVTAGDPVGIAKEVLLNPKIYNGFMGISQGKPYFTNKETMETYFKFALKYFDNFLVLVDDWLAQHNYASFGGMNDKQARQKASELGLQNVRTFERVKRKLQKEGAGVERITIGKISDLMHDPTVEERIAIIEDHYRSDPVLRDDMNAWFMKYMGEKVRKRGLSGHELNRVMERSLWYLKDELALLLTVPERGYPVEIYPGTNEVQQQIVQSKYVALRKDLKLEGDFGHLDVRVRDRKSYSLASMVTKDEITREKIADAIEFVGITGLMAAQLMLSLAALYSTPTAEDHARKYGTNVCEHRYVILPPHGPPMPLCWVEMTKK